MEKLFKLHPVEVEHCEEDFEEGEEEEEEASFMISDNVPVRITLEGLYIGSCMAEQNKSALKKEGITHILQAGHATSALATLQTHTHTHTHICQVAEGLEPSHPDDFKYLNIKVADMPSEDLVCHFPKCFPFIDEAISLSEASDSGGGVLVQ